MQTQPPGMTPSPQVLRLYRFRCTVCTASWFELGPQPVAPKSMHITHCDKPTEYVDNYRVQVDPAKRV